MEYCSYILEAVTTGQAVPLDGQRAQRRLHHQPAAGCCVEVPTFADDTGLHPTVIGALPPQCAAACMTNINVQQLCAEAALSGDPEHLVHALALDPLTAAVCTLKEIRDMTGEMLEELRPYLPQFEGKCIAPDADDQHPARLRRRRRAARSGARHRQTVRHADRAENRRSRPSTGVMQEE